MGTVRRKDGALIFVVTVPKTQNSPKAPHNIVAGPKNFEIESLEL